MKCSKRTFTVLCLSAYGVFCLVLFAAGWSLGQWRGEIDRATRPPLATGERVLSMPENGILSVMYFAPNLSLTAQRAGPGQRFSVLVTLAHGGAARHCLADPDLDGLLPLLSGLTAGDGPLESGNDDSEEGTREGIDDNARAAADPQPALLAVQGQIQGWRPLRAPGRDIFEIRRARGEVYLYQYRGGDSLLQLAAPSALLNKLEAICPDFTAQ